VINGDPRHHATRVYLIHGQVDLRLCGGRHAFEASRWSHRL